MSNPTALVARLRVPSGWALGFVVLWLAHPTSSSIAFGAAVAASGEAIRIWAAGHLEKGRQVAMSGPYRLTRHPLYVGSTIMALGLAIASMSVAVAVVIGSYLALTLTAAIRSEEAFLRRKFAGEYDAYVAGHVAGRRPFSWARALANREHRTVIGLLLAILTLALKAWLKV